MEALTAIAAISTSLSLSKSGNKSAGVSSLVLFPGNVVGEVLTMATLQLLGRDAEMTISFVLKIHAHVSLELSLMA